MDSNLAPLQKEIQACTFCSEFLELGPRPVVQIHAKAKILIAGQAPGIRVHTSGIPFDDPSGNRLRDWMGITKEQFYNPKLLAIVPMAFCYPGKGKTGDLPPRKECADHWRKRVLKALPNIELTLVIGQYAMDYHFGKGAKLTDRVKQFHEFLPDRIPLPHPSPRNRFWMGKNPWFSDLVLPSLKQRVKEII